MMMTGEEAWKLLCRYNEEPFHQKHALTVAGVTRYFAAGCSREVIERGAEMLGWTLDDLISRTVLAMRTVPAVD